MAVINILKKTACWSSVFLCLLSFGTTSLVLGGQSSGTVQSGEVKITGRVGKESTAHPEKVESVKPGQAARSASPSLKRKVTAGWYGPGHHKKLTANGQRFNMFENTLAHKTLPFGTKVRLVTLDKKRSAVGVVNDRGPYVKGRDLDVSYALAKQLGFVGKGVAKLYLIQAED
jgi:rare lipoprotein A (peptidoglycan hydrolase)